MALHNLTYKEVLVKRFVICYKHFKSTDYWCGSVRKLKQGAVPSLLLPEKIESVSSDEGDDAEEIDAVEKSSPSRETNLTPPTSDFSPVTYRNWISKSSGGVSLRRSSLVAVKDDPISTPKSSRNKLTEEISLSREAEDITPGTDSIRESIFSEEIRPEGETGNKEIEKSDVNEIENAASSTKGLKSKGCKRLIWKNRELDEPTRKMYEHVLEAKQEIYALKCKNLRYCDIKHFQLKTKYMKKF